MTKKITRLFDCIQYQKDNFPQQKSLVYKEDNQWISYSTQEFIDISNQVSRSLLKLGVKPNDKIAIIVPLNQPKWHFIDVGVLQIGAQNVPLYATLSEKDYQYVLEFRHSLAFWYASLNSLSGFSTISSLASPSAFEIDPAKDPAFSMGDIEFLLLFAAAFACHSSRFS